MNWPIYRPEYRDETVNPFARKIRLELSGFGKKDAPAAARIAKIPDAEEFQRFGELRRTRPNCGVRRVFRTPKKTIAM